MSEHCGYIVQVKELRHHSNADRLQVATFFGNDTCVNLNTQLGDIGIYFPTDLQLSKEYCEANKLVRMKDENGNNIGGYMDPDKRNVKTIRLRGENSDGLYMPICSLEFTGFDLSELNIGDTITEVNGIPICKKYIPRGKTHVHHVHVNRTRKHKEPIAPLFAEHTDTEQLDYNLQAFTVGDLVEITLKMHGTSQRTGYLPVLKGYKKTIWDRLFRRNGTPIYEWDYVTGTRRVVLEDFEDGGYYDDNAFREIHAKKLEGKLHKGETVYYEVVGFTTNGTPIMASSSNSKVNDKEFTKRYGDETVFSYGCNPDPSLGTPQSEMYVYRMTMTNEDGDVVEYTPDFMRYRCEQMGVNCVPVFSEFILDEFRCEVDERTPGEMVRDECHLFYDGPDPIGKTHIREGVVARIVNRPSFTAYKTKNIYFKILEGIVKETAIAPDMEEAQELVGDEALTNNE